MAVNPMTRLKNDKYISLTTFRRTGVAVATPVWFVQDGGHLLVRTGATTGKVKRIRNNTQVTVAPCTGMGKVTGPVWNARATILPAGSERRVDQLIGRKHRIAMPLIFGFRALVRVVRRRPRAAVACLQIDFEEPSAGADLGSSA